VRRAYLDEVKRFTEGHRRALAEGDVEYHLVDTSRPPSEIIIQFLNGPWRRAA
jgi:hypothetical protein